MWETWAQSLAWEDPLETGMATHSSIFAWRIPRTEELGRLQFMGLQTVRHDRVTFTLIAVKAFSPVPKAQTLFTLFSRACPSPRPV